jgi:glycosyltransferase involved in cell wall biosynthesis
MKIVQATSSIELASAGTTYCVTRLAEALAERGHDVELIATSRTPRELQQGGLRVRECQRDFQAWPWSAQVMASRAFAEYMDRAAASGAIVHSNGLWRLPNIYPSRTARRHGVPLVISPHGMLAKAALAFSSRKKKVFDALFQRQALLTADCFHATSDEEVDEIRNYGLSQPVALIPHGIDVPAMRVASCAGHGRARTVLYLGRIHPKKGLDRLLSAWAKIESAYPEWRMRIVGPSEVGHGDELRAQSRALGLTRVYFEDGLYGDEKEVAYSSADVFVLPSLNENFAMVVAEALAAGTPVISTKGAPWSGLASNRCGWWIDHGPEPLAAALGQAMSLPRNELAAMGARGRAWMEREFSWTRVAVEMVQVYSWLRGGGERPDFVR